MSLTSTPSSRALIWVVVAVAAVLLLAAAAFGATSAINTAIDDAYNRGAASVTRDDDVLQEAFDKGMAAGVEYQEWFCHNEVTVSAPNGTVAP
ncbi:hypothetical protein [Plantibacter sp. YIM 135249]|uniref:hypothetical protein n=1 Tax=Plantibacter sp. YIM 135249 TaxID=3423918 RepID=UPI003D336EB6